MLPPYFLFVFLSDAVDQFMLVMKGFSPELLVGDELGQVMEEGEGLSDFADEVEFVTLLFYHVHFFAYHLH